MDFSKEKFDIIILAGQSNAEGYGLGDVEHEFQENENIFVLEDKNRSSIFIDEKFRLNFEEFEPNIHIAKIRKNDKGELLGSLTYSFSENYFNNGLLKNGRKLLIIYTAIGGTGFARYQWGEATVLQDRMFKMVDYALSLNKENKVVAFLWHQGEHDAFENAELSYKTRKLFYYEKFGFLIKKVKEKYGNFPIIAGGFCSEWVNSGYKEQCKAVNKATKKVLKQNGGLFVETVDLKSNNQTLKNGDGIHFSRQSLNILGERYFNAYMKLRSKS